MTTTTILGSAAAWPIMILAHNEERQIVRCLDSIFADTDPHPVEIYVMANGCSDRTEDLVREYAKRRPEVHLVSIALGDKCNAWNVFIHQTVVERCPARAMYVFMDGDARCVPGSLAALARGLDAEPYAHAASAPPVSGRNAERDAEALLRERGLVANLYALRGDFVQRLVNEGVRLPLKLEGDDGLLGALIKWDLDPKHNQFDHLRIVACPKAGFEFDSVSPLSYSAARGYWRRAVRYGRRRFEFQLLGKKLKAAGLAGLPADITELYGEAAKLRVRWDGVYTVTSWVARREMRDAWARRQGQPRSA